MDPDYHAKFAIHEATREGKTSEVESFLNANPKLAVLRDGDDRLPIHWAAAYNQMPIARLLMSHNDFDPDVVDSSGWTPLMIAASLKDGEGEAMVKLLLQKGADANLKSLAGQNAIHFATSKGNTDIIRALLASKCSARLRDNRGQLALHRAAAIGSVPILNLLLKEGNSPLNASDADGLTPLHHAVSEGHGEAALILLRAGAEADKRDNDGHLAIDLAPDIKVRKFILTAAEHEGIELP
ncbi:putative ankyrin-repeat protein [Ophidiomyces ophidiicola]|uniref:putative ankyrin-repeat protein n=1 Tax=Ophidiomyces ophidiicola TaxID=1387563 RepID=UPI0020C5259A|nr:putative ankyrin-repeat protein [Ophidiomyces ophidiicola]KAI1953890.1 putative ankyrin-repeat protein [Ophidiomyces ophidiicola]KAI2062693.1 putative ankyrin-repeat protein [Ophidiomyces ophidiicola]